MRVSISIAGMRTGRVLVTAVLLAACDSTASRGTLGTVALSEAGSGELRIVDVETGATLQRIARRAGPPGAIAMSPDGTHVAYAVEPELFDRRVRVADVASGDVLEVEPGTGQMMPFFRWGGPGWFTYARYEGGNASSWLAGTDTGDARQLGAFENGVPLGSPDGAWLARAECETVPMPTCARTLVVERPDGSEARVLARGVLDLALVGWSPDGTRLFGIEDVGGAGHLVARDALTGAALDLGEAGSIHDWPVWFPTHASSISPDGGEVLVRRAGELTAVRTDGSGARGFDGTASISRAGFSARGDVIWQVDENLTPGDDTPEYEYTVFVADAGGTRVLHPADRGCQAATLSPSGALLALACGDRIVVRRVDDGTMVGELDGRDALGFVPGEVGLVVSRATGESDRFEVWYTPLGGNPRLLGAVGYLDAGDGQSVVEWPPFAYAP
jgi:hypothetical protein